MCIGFKPAERKSQWLPEKLNARAFGEAEIAEDKDSSTNEDKSATNKSPVDGQNQPGLLWRMSSQLYNIGSGAVGMGVGSVKWAASTTYNVGTGVVSATQTVVSKVVPSAMPKPKKE